MLNVYTPRARNRDGMDDPNGAAPFAAVARYSADTSTSSVVTVTDNTTTLEVGALGGTGVVLKWIANTDTTASVVATGATRNFDFFVPAGAVRRFAIPVEGRGTASIVGANKQNGLYNRVAWVAAGAPASSVVATEYA